MEIDEQMVACSALQEVDTIVHSGLRVAVEEVYLHTCHSDTFTPCKIPFAVIGLVQLIFRTWGSVYPTCCGVVPNHWLHAL